MAANEKQLEKVTLTLTNKMAGSRGPPVGPPGRRATKVSIKWQETSISCLRQTSQVNTHARACTPTCSAADLTHIQSHPASVVSMATDFNLINWVENCETDARSISRLIPPLPFAGMYRTFHELLEVYQTIVKLTQTHTLSVYTSLCDSTNLYILPFSVSAKGICDLAD